MLMSTHTPSHKCLQVHVSIETVSVEVLLSHRLEDLWFHVHPAGVQTEKGAGSMNVSWPVLNAPARAGILWTCSLNVLGVLTLGAILTGSKGQAEARVWTRFRRICSNPESPGAETLTDEPRVSFPLTCSLTVVTLKVRNRLTAGGQTGRGFSSTTRLTLSFWRLTAESSQVDEGVFAANHLVIYSTWEQEDSGRIYLMQMKMEFEFYWAWRPGDKKGSTLISWCEVC